MLGESPAVAAWPGFREDVTFAQDGHNAATDVVFRFDTATIRGLAVGGLRPRFNPKRVSLAQTALRL
jgi:hypothetical protein